MVTIRFRPIEVQEMLLWGKIYKEHQEEVNVPWDDEQEGILIKLRKSIGKQEMSPTATGKETK